MKILISESQFVMLVEQSKNIMVDLGSRLGKALSDVPVAKVSRTFNFDKALKGIESSKPKWNYDIVKISDNLNMVRNPKGGGMKYKNSTIKRVENPITKEYIDLKWGEDEFGMYYYMSAEMRNPIDAGRAIDALKKEIPSGSRFGEPAKSSLSTDSFYSMLRRLKNFTPKVVGYLKLNGYGETRYSEFMKNSIISDGYPSIIQFKNKKDAVELVNHLNKEIKNFGLESQSKISLNDENGYFEILIPNIHLYIK